MNLKDNDLKKALDKIDTGELFDLKDGLYGVYISKWLSNAAINGEAEVFITLVDIIKALREKNKELERVNGWLREGRARYCEGCEEREHEVRILKCQLEEVRKLAKELYQVLPQKNEKGYGNSIYMRICRSEREQMVGVLAREGYPDPVWIEFWEKRICEGDIRRGIFRKSTLDRLLDEPQPPVKGGKQ